MRLLSALLALPALVLPCALSAQQTAAPANVKVMIVGSFHMSNPGHDLHNIHVEDVLQPKPQAQIKAVIDELAAFHPTKIMTEWPKDLVDERFPKFMAGTLPPSHNEVVQLGFRLAKQAGVKQVFGIDVDGDFPYGPVDAYARAHGQSALLDQSSNETEDMVQHVDHTLQQGGIGAALRYLNDPKRLQTDNSFYRRLLFVGNGTDQPGAALLTAWYKRNLLICANILQKSQTGDRIVIFYGSGHAFLLRQCVQETPGFTLVEADDYLKTK